MAIVEPSLQSRLAALAAPVCLVLLTCVACGKPQVAPSAPATPAAVVEQPVSEAVQTVSATGTVLGIDTTKGLLSLRQAAVSEMAWPAMTIAYPMADLAVLDLNPGDRIAFDLEVGGGGYVRNARKL